MAKFGQKPYLSGALHKQSFSLVYKAGQSSIPGIQFFIYSEVILLQPSGHYEERGLEKEFKNEQVKYNAENIEDHNRFQSFAIRKTTFSLNFFVCREVRSGRVSSLIF